MAGSRLTGVHPPGRPVTAIIPTHPAARPVTAIIPAQPVTAIINQPQRDDPANEPVHQQQPSECVFVYVYPKWIPARPVMSVCNLPYIPLNHLPAAAWTEQSEHYHAKKRTNDSVTPGGAAAP